MASASDIQTLPTLSAPATSTMAHQPSSSSSQPAPRVIFHPLQNYNYAGPAPKAAPAKAQPTLVYVGDARTMSSNNNEEDEDMQQVDISTSRAADSTASAPNTPAVPPVAPNATRGTMLNTFDYSTMKCKRTHTDLPKKPNPTEPWVVFHSPATPGVTYESFFGTTHDFLDVQLTLELFPSFVDLPQELRPSKARYEATKANANDAALRVRCLFCRGRFAGINSKAIWERHVKDHWPKEAHASTSTGEVRRPSRHVPKRPSGANAHTRNKSHDNGNWRPTVRRDRSIDDNYVDDNGSETSSRASSVAPEFSAPRPHTIRHAPYQIAARPKPVAAPTTAKPTKQESEEERKYMVYFPHQPPHMPLHHKAASAVCHIPNYVPKDHKNKDTSMTNGYSAEAPIHVNQVAPVTPKKTTMDSNTMIMAPDWEDMFGDSPIRPIGGWNVQNDIEEHKRLSHLPSTMELLVACMEAGARSSAQKTDQGSETSSLSSHKKRSREDESFYSDGDEEIMDATTMPPFVKRRRVTSIHSVSSLSSFSSYAATSSSDHDDSSFEASFDTADSPMAESPFIGTPEADSPMSLLDLDKVF